MKLPINYDSDITRIPKEKSVYCPICGSDCDTIYIDHYGDICGCNNCIEPHNAWEVLDV